jgi:hypothetical protein
MKKIILINSILLLIISSCRSQEKKNELEYQNDNLIQNIGIGLVQLVKVEENIVLYADTTFLETKTKKAKLGKDIIPLLNKPDYGILFFTCIEKKNKYYKIVTAKNTFAYIKSTQNFIFYSWNEFLKDQVVSIVSKNLKENPPRNSINGKSINIKEWNSDDEIEVIKIQGNWLQVKNITQDNKLFWIEWRNDKTLKVYLNLLI